MNNIKIRLLSTKNPALTKLNLLSQFQYYHVFVGVAVIILFNIPFIIIFLYFVKKFILKPKRFRRLTPLIMLSSETKKCWQYSINLFVGERKLNLVTKRVSNKRF